MNLDDEKAKLAMLIKKSQEEFSPLLCKEYKVKYECYRAAGFTVKEALRLAVGCYD